MCLCARFIPSSCHPWCVLERSLSVSSCLSFSCFSPSFASSLPQSTCTLPRTPSPMSITPRDKTAVPSHNEEYCTMVIYHPLTGYEPNVLNDFHCSETSAMIFQDESGDIDTEPSYSCDAELDDDTTGKSAVFTTVYSGARGTSELETSLSLSLRKFVASTLERRGPYTNLVCAKNESQVAKWKTKESEFSLKDKKRANSRWSQNRDPEARISSIQDLNGIIESQRREIDDTVAGDEQLRRDQLLLHEQLSEQNRNLREAHIKSLYQMEELKRVQESRVDESSRRRLIENRDTIPELTGNIQELQNEVNCMNDSRDFKDAESVRSGLSHVPSQPALLPTLSRSGRDAKSQR